MRFAVAERERLDWHDLGGGMFPLINHKDLMSSMSELSNEIGPVDRRRLG